MINWKLVVSAGLAVACAHAASGQSKRRDGDALVPIGQGCSKAAAAARWFAAGQPPEEDPEGYCAVCDTVELTDVLNCALDVELFPSTSSISGSNTFTIMSKMDGLTTFTFRLRSQFVISAATINGSTAVPVANPTTTTRVATLDRAYNNGEIFTLRIDYSGVPQSVGSFGSVQFTTQNSQPLFQTLSEPYYAYTWWPCKDGDNATVGDNSDKFTSQVSITAPDTLTSVSNGLLQGVDVLSGSRKRYRWATAYPLSTYLVFINSTVYNQWEQDYTYPLPGGGNGVMPVQFSIYPANDTGAHRTAWANCLNMLAAYRPFYGEYPFINEKYGIYNFNFSGGQEHQTYTGEGTFSESVTAHELGHQWWGDNITCKTWPDVWLNEGFATYTECLWEEHKPGSTGLPAYLAAIQARRPSAVSGTVYRTDVSNAATIFSSTYAYDKGAWALHQLRHVVGDNTFYAILAAYRSAFQGSAATTDDFKNVASSVFGQDLSWFFNEWVYGPGAVAYAAGWQTIAVNGQNYLQLRIRQTQTPTYPVFTMPVDVRVNTAGGNQTVKVWNNAATDWYVVPIAQPATSIVVDENGWILTTANVQEAYVNGPPKIVQAAPAPGQSYAPGAGPSQLTVTFSENVATTGADYVLTGPGGPAPLSFSYDGGSFTATLSAGAPLPAGAYMLRVKDTVVSSAASVRLDGEIADPSSPASLPSGEGQPLGDALWAFTVQGLPCYANCDGSTTAPILNVLDFGCFLNRFAAGDTWANCDGSTTAPVLNVLDFACFLNAFAAGCS
jgi:hypothetical protein